MIIEETLLAAIVDAVIAYTFEKSADKLGKRVRERLGLDPTRNALKEALSQAFEHLSQRHPQWVADNFDASFFEREGASVLAQFLVMDGHPDASELASRWADSLNISNPERRAYYNSELEPIAVDFLEDLAHQLKGKEALRELNISRAIDQTTEALQALRQQFGAEKATPGTWHDYLRWLIDRNLYLDPRGTYQTQRQVQLRLDDVYISLQAQYGEAANAVDRQLYEQELAALEAEITAASMAAEEREDRRDQLQLGLERQINPDKSAVMFEFLSKDLAISVNVPKLKTEKPAEVLELAEVVARYDRAVILGDPGSGKSTLLRYLALKHAKALRDGRAEAGTDLGRARFPLLIRIAEYAEEGAWREQSLSDFLTQHFARHECPKRGLSNLLLSELDRGNCLVLLDGLDEVVSAEERLGVVRQIEDFVRRYSHKANRFVITSRIAGYRSAPLGEPFAHYTVQEMNEAQMRRFLEHWCKAVEDAQTPELSVQERSYAARREIESIMRAIQNPGVRRLASNPLLLRILALIHHTGARLPQKRIELYKLATDTLARTWRPAQGVSESALAKESTMLKEDYLTPLLSTLAYWLHVDKPTGLATERDVYVILGEAWARLNEWHWDADAPNPKITEEIRKFLVVVHEHTGLFVERAPKRYGFMHLTFEEYYAARYLIARPKLSARRIRQHLHLPRWEEPILLALGFVGLEYPAEASALVETAILARGDEAEELEFTPSPHEDLLGRDYLFALRCLSDSIPVRPRLLKQLMERMSDELLHHKASARFERYREALLERLANLEGSEGATFLFPFLVRALQDADAEVRWWAAWSLGQLGQTSPEAVAALLGALQDIHADAEVRRLAAGHLGQLGQASPEVIAALLGALHDTDAAVRRLAVWGLGRVGQSSPEVIASLLDALHDTDAAVRERVAESLGQLGQASPEAVVALLGVLTDTDAGAEVRRQTAESLGQLGQASPEVIAALLGVLHNTDTDAAVRRQTAESLGQLGQASPEVIVELYETLQKAGNPEMRCEAARLLGQICQGDSATVDILWSSLLCEDVEVRRACAQALVRLGKRSTTITPLIEKRLVQVIQDPQFSKPEQWGGRSVYDYAYEGL